MILYTLNCENAHGFDAWFPDSAAFESQQKSGEVVCPLCGSANVSKNIMAPSLGASSVGAGKNTDKQQVVHTGKDQAELRAMMRAVREHVTKNAEYVGPRFADEARKIHYEESEPRGIYGEASGEEVNALKEEGVDVHPLPILPEDQN
jgi:hypothetical protein